MKLPRQPPCVPFRANPEGRAAAFLFLLLLIISAPTASRTTNAQTTGAQPQADGAATAPQASRNKSTVRGRVVYEDTNRPLRRASVTLYDPGSMKKQPRMASTDSKGEFILKNVAAGKYYVMVEAPGIIKQEIFEGGQDMTDVASVSVNGTNSAEVRVLARRGGVVSGKVTYADGDPAVNAAITIQRKKDGQMVTVYVAGDCGMGPRTDERGIYRVAGLTPGEYVIGAAEQKTREVVDDDRGGIGTDVAMVSLTYYDGATSSRGATPIQVEAGSEANNVNITLVDRSTHQVSGTLVMRGDSRPLTRARINLVNKDESSIGHPYYGTQETNPDSQGRWSLDEVVDGNYTISVAPMMEYERYSIDDRDGQPISNRVKPPNFLVKRQDVTVAGSDVTGLLIEVSGGGRVSGTVTVEGGKPLPPTVAIYPETASGERKIQLSHTLGRAQPDGTFSLDGMPSDGIWLRAVSRQDNKYYTKSVTANGVDLMHEPLAVKEGEEVRGVRIVISPDVATLTGRVLESEGGAPLRGASLMLVPAAPHQQRIRSARLYALTNAEGGFTLTGAPGEYAAIVMRPGGEIYSLGDDDIKARAAAAQRITLQPTERKNIDLIAPLSRK